MLNRRSVAVSRMPEGRADRPREREYKKRRMERRGQKRKEEERSFF